MKLKKGFTLIELLIVIVIMGILAAIVVGLVATNSRNRANDVTKKADLREVQTALEQYFVDHDAYPAGNYAGLDAILVPTYLAKLPVSPDAANPYQYTPANSNTTYTLSVTLKNTNDKQATNGVYSLTEKQ